MGGAKLVRRREREKRTDRKAFFLFFSLNVLYAFMLARYCFDNIPMEGHLHPPRLSWIVDLFAPPPSAST